MCNNTSCEVECVIVATLLVRNRWYKDQQGFTFTCFSSQLSLAHRGSIEHRGASFALSPLCRRHGRYDVIARAHTQHMLSPGFCSNQTTAASSSLDVATSVQWRGPCLPRKHGKRQKKKEKRKRSWVNVRSAIRAVMDNKRFYFAFVFF